jgi:hypothetical protein
MNKNDMVVDEKALERAQQVMVDFIDGMTALGAPLQSMPGTDIGLYPFGGSFSIAAIGYLRLFSVTPLEFTMGGSKYTFSGEGGGVAFGGGIFAGVGGFFVHPSTLPGSRVELAVAGTPGFPNALSITWLRGGVPIGSFHGTGLSVFGGVGGGVGDFRVV